MRRNKAKHIRQQLLAEFCQKGTVLDLGFASRPNSSLKDAVGLDIALPKEKPINYRDMVKCNLNTDNMPFADETFDNIIAGEIIEHVENPSHLLREGNRVLKTGGRLIISTPQANDWWTTLYNWFFRRWAHDSNEVHLQNWTISDMTRLLKKNGFKIENIEGLFMKIPKLDIYIRVKKLLPLSWSIFYIAQKVSAPDTNVLTTVEGQKLSIAQ